MAGDITETGYIARPERDRIWRKTGVRQDNEGDRTESGYGGRQD
jgi:hypothetical protein